MAQRNWRRLLQIKLRTVLLLVLVLSLPLAWCATRLNRGRQQRPVVEAIEKAGGKVWVVGQLAAKSLNDPRLFAPRIYDSQRREEGALDQMVEEVKLGDVVCVAFWNGATRNALPDDGSKTTRAGWPPPVGGCTSTRATPGEDIGFRPIRRRSNGRSFRSFLRSRCLTWETGR